MDAFAIEGNKAKAAEAAPVIEALQAAAREYAAARSRMEADAARILQDTARAPEWEAWYQADVAASAAKARLNQVRAAHPLSLGAPVRARETELAEQRLGEAWAAAAEHKPKKTWATPEGEVQVRVTKGIEVTDPRALCEDLLSRRLFDYVKSVKVDAKMLRPLLDGKEPPKGVKVADTVAVAFTPGGQA